MKGIRNNYQSKHTCFGIIVTFALLFLVTGLASDAAAGQMHNRVALESMKSAYPGLKTHENGPVITRLYGRTFGTGSSVEATAEGFRQNYAPVLGVSQDDLRSVSSIGDGRHTQPLMYDRQTGTYKFTLVTYSQFHEDVPVFRSNVRLLIRNDEAHSLVMASSSIRDLGAYQVKGQHRGINPDAIAASFNDPTFMDPDIVGPARQVIFAGIDGSMEEPRMAVEFVASDAPPTSEAYHYVVDVETGEILHKESLIHHEDVVGNVAGFATQGTAAEHCEAELSEPIGDARVNIGGTVAYTDTDGDFVIPNGGVTDVTVESRLWGHWFRVYNGAGSDALLSQVVLPPGPANFVHNQANTEEYRAQVNAFVEANFIRDFIEDCNPSFPGLDVEEFEINVNLSAGWCPGNAMYSGADTSMNFCLAGEEHPNTAWSSVLYHEYGHHLVHCAGNAQGAYGEGIGDCIAVLATDESETGLGFFGECSQPLRDADNTKQYPCAQGEEIHICGMLLSGCVWSTRNELAVTYPSTYLDILTDLTVNSILLHNYTDKIDPSITIDFLTLDDDDGDLSNGTPHYTEIINGFGAHNMGLPTVVTIHVDAVLGDDLTGDGSPAYPYKTIQMGIDQANFLDTVLVKPGTYEEQIDFSGKVVVVKSSEGPLVTSLYWSQAQGNMVTFGNSEDRRSILEGFTVEGGNIGVHCNYSWPSIIGNIFVGQNQHAIYAYSDLFAFPWITADIRNNTITGCAGDAVWLYSLPYSGCGHIVKNNIIAFNTGTGIVRGDPFGGWYVSEHPELSYNDVYGNGTNYGPDLTPGTGSFSSDPLFDTDYSLLAGSPCIDAGDPDPIYNDADGTRNDMGAVPHLVMTIYVPQDYATIQGAIDAAGEGCTIIVSPGTYTESLTFGTKALTVVSSDGPQVTTVTNGPGQDLVVFSNSPASTTLEGFRLEGGRMAIWCQSSAPTVRGCLMVDQNITNWAAVVLSGNGWASTGPSPAVLENNTIVSSANGAISTFSTVAPTIKNTIVADCVYGIHHQGWPSTVAPVLSYNNIWDCSWFHYANCPDTGVGTISEDPEFTWAYALYGGSPCIDAGDPDGAYDDPDGTRNDMGALPTYQVGSGLVYQNVQPAVDDVEAGDVVLLEYGTYTLTQSLDFGGKDIVVMSADYSDRATITTLNNSMDLVVFDEGETANAELRNLRLFRGRIGIWCKNSAPTIRGCLLDDQQITNWAAVVLSGPSWGTIGPSAATLINNTVVSSGNGGISTFSTVAPIIKNTIVANCTYGIHHYGSGTVAPILSYNDVWNCSWFHYANCPDTGVGTISANPQFVSNYRLGLFSPCINAGDPDPQYNDPDGSRNDMGWRPFEMTRVILKQDELASLPESFELSQNYPNPFNPATKIEFTLPQACRVELAVYNLLGRRVCLLASGEFDAGSHSVEWNGTNSAGEPVASGIYLYRLQAMDRTATKKMLLLK